MAYDGIAAAAAVKESSEKGHSTILVGWDKNEASVQFTADGYISGLLLQNPDLMGIYAIDAVVTLEDGGTLDPTPVDTGINMATKDNIDELLGKIPSER